MAENNKKIEQMNREELHDLIEELNKEIQTAVHSGTQNFHRAMRADEQKQKVQKRLAELEDYPTQQQQKKQKPFVQNAFDSSY